MNQVHFRVQAQMLFWFARRERDTIESSDIPHEASGYCMAAFRQHSHKKRLKVHGAELSHDPIPITAMIPPA
jgi:hypothetical protein